MVCCGGGGWAVMCCGVVSLPDGNAAVCSE